MAEILWACRFVTPAKQVKLLKNRFCNVAVLPVVNVNRKSEKREETKK